MREQDEWDEGHIPGAIHIPRGDLESRIEAACPIARARSSSTAPPAIARPSPPTPSRELGYEPSVSLAGGFTDWKRNGLRVDLPKRLSPERRARYSRHLLIPEIGEEGQLKLLDSRILLHRSRRARLARGALPGGRGSRAHRDRRRRHRRRVEPAAPDRHSLNTLGTPKVDSAKRAIEALNPDVEVTTYRERLTSENIDRILDDGWEIIVDGADNFPTRYLVNDASVWRNIPVVHGSIYRFEGQVTVFKPGGGPCYRCLYPAPPPPELAPSCSEGGVLGVLPGIVGTLQTNEALKLALGMGDPLIGRLLLFDALATRLPGGAIGATRTARSAASIRRSPSTSTTSSSAESPGEHRPRSPGPARGSRRRSASSRRSGATVRELLEDLSFRVPALGTKVYDGTEIRPYVNVYVDGEDVRTSGGLDAPVREDATVVLLPAMAGGDGR